MQTKVLQTRIILLGILIAVLHAVALTKSYYWVFPWFDIMMHFLGGALVMLFGLWAYERYLKTSFMTSSGKRIFFHIILFLFIVAFFWETFELSFGLRVEDQREYLTDTVIDFIMNTIGATVAYLYAKKLFLKNV